MNSIWLKIAAAVVAVFVVIVVIDKFKSGEPTPAPSSSSAEEDRPKNFYDQVEEDKARFQTSPEPAEKAAPEQTSAASQEPAQPEETPAQTQPAQSAVRPPAPTQPPTIYVKRLSEIDQIEAERLLSVAVPGRSIGRLPMTGYKLMVDNCRRIIQKWPDSFYAFQSQRLLADLPERYKMRYKVTKAEMDLSNFTKQRPGTEPVTVTEER